MARVYLLTTPGTYLNVIYTVDQAVGRGRPNKQDDVALVQFLTRRVLEGWNDLPPGRPALMIDGVFSENTYRYVEYFQNGQNERSPPGFLIADGVISPMPNRSGVVPNSDKMYTIVNLNTNYSDRWGKTWHSNIAIDSLCPTHLLPSIFWS